MAATPNPEWDFLFQIKSLHKPGALGKVLTVIGEEGGLIGDITTLSVGKTDSCRNITISVYDMDHRHRIEKAINERTEGKVMHVRDVVFERHVGGKIHCGRVHDLHSLTDLRYIYTPGVARVCKAIQEDPDNAKIYTGISNSVGIFTNGTRILGLGDIGPVAGMPVMEGKAVLYDQFVEISAVPILVDTKDPDEFVETVIRIAPTFGGIHLEDISAPACFYIEKKLIETLDKPVMHDDQHGTATVTLAAVMSAIRLAGKDENQKYKVAQIGLGAAGFGIAKLLLEYGLDVIGVDLNVNAQEMLLEEGGDVATLEEAMQTADIVISTTGVPGLIKKEMIRKGQIILALSNPTPEIMPEEALDAGAAFAADGKSINNALAFPGLFKAALEMEADSISSKMKIAAAKAISALADKDELVPSIFHHDVHEAVIKAVIEAGEE